MDEQQPMPRKQGAGARRRTLLLRAGVAARRRGGLGGRAQRRQPVRVERVDDRAAGRRRARAAAERDPPHEDAGPADEPRRQRRDLERRKLAGDGGSRSTGARSRSAPKAAALRRRSPTASRTALRGRHQHGLHRDPSPCRVRLVIDGGPHRRKISAVTRRAGSQSGHRRPSRSPRRMRVTATTTTRVMSDKDAKLLLAKVQGGDATPQVDDGGSAGTLDGDDGGSVPRRDPRDAAFRNGAWKTGRLSIDGREAIRLVATQRCPKPGAPRPVDETYIVDARTYDPIEWRTTRRRRRHHPALRGVRAARRTRPPTGLFSASPSSTPTPASTATRRTSRRPRPACSRTADRLAGEPMGRGSRRGPARRHEEATGAGAPCRRARPRPEVGFRRRGVGHRIEKYCSISNEVTCSR